MQKQPRIVYMVSVNYIQPLIYILILSKNRRVASGPLSRHAFVLYGRVQQVAYGFLNRLKVINSASEGASSVRLWSRSCPLWSTDWQGQGKKWLLVQLRLEPERVHCLQIQLQLEGVHCLHVKLCPDGEHCLQVQLVS